MKQHESRIEYKDVSFILLDSESKQAVLVDSLPTEEWRSLRFDILKRLVGSQEGTGES